MIPKNTPTIKADLSNTIIDLVNKLTPQQQLEALFQIKLIAQNKERRKSNRKKINAMVDYTVSGKLYSGSINDLSATGVFIKSSRIFQVGTKTIIVIAIPEVDYPIKTFGEIVRGASEGFGVRFTAPLKIQF